MLRFEEESRSYDHQKEEDPHSVNGSWGRSAAESHWDVANCIDRGEGASVLAGVAVGVEGVWAGAAGIVAFLCWNGEDKEEGDEKHSRVFQKHDIN